MNMETEKSGKKLMRCKQSSTSQLTGKLKNKNGTTIQYASRLIVQWNKRSGKQNAVFDGQGGIVKFRLFAAKSLIVVVGGNWLFNLRNRKGSCPDA